SSWKRKMAPANEKDGTKLAARAVKMTALVTTYVAVVPIILPRIVATRQVYKTDLQISDASPNAPGVLKKEGKRVFDPHGDFNFIVQIDGLTSGSDVFAFQKVDGLEIDFDLIEYADSMDPHAHKRRGVQRFGNLKLTKGVIDNIKLWAWCCATMEGEVDRRNGTIKVLDDAGKESGLAYDFHGAWPCKWSGMRVDGKGGATLVEELELVIDSFTRA
ncbi:MAG: phage tail-like protein, partial [Myxococcota bacterium]